MIRYAKFFSEYINYIVFNYSGTSPLGHLSKGATLLIGPLIKRPVLFSFYFLYEITLIKGPTSLLAIVDTNRRGQTNNRLKGSVIKLDIEIVCLMCEPFRRLQSAWVVID